MSSDPFDLQPGESMSVEDLPLVPDDVQKELTAKHEHGPDCGCADHTPAPSATITGRTLIFLEHPGQEFTDFVPVFANIDRSQCKVVLINLANAPACGFLAAMTKFGVGEWDVWGYNRPPPNLNGVMRRMIDLIDQWEPQTIFAPDSSPALAAMSRFRPNLHDNHVPRLFLTFSEGFADDAISLTCDRAIFDKLEIIHLDCYARTGTFKSIQTYVEQQL